MQLFLDEMKAYIYNSTEDLCWQCDFMLETSSSTSQQIL
jgi:hypothetical protein